MSFGIGYREREKKVYEGVPRPAYRGIKSPVSGNERPADSRLGFLTEGLELITKKGSSNIGDYSLEAYFDPQRGMYSGVALVKFESGLGSGVRLEVSLNGLGENKARQKLHRVIRQHEDSLKKASGNYSIVGTKRADRKATTRARTKTRAKVGPWSPSAQYGVRLRF